VTAVTPAPTGSAVAGNLGRIERTLRQRRASGAKLLVPYVTGGVRDDWLQILRAMAFAGADAVEVGIPFSDPVMDGPTIQEASALALERGTTPEGILADLQHLDAGVPLVVMTYYNLVFRFGHDRFARRLVEAGVQGAIVPDLPLEESAGWEADAAAAGVETILLTAPVTPDDRLSRICARSHGFVYGVGLMGVTGERTSLAASAGTMAKRLKAVTDKPVLIGIGVSTPEQAREVCAEADGAVVGSALVRMVLDGADPEAIGQRVAAMRTAIDTR
jgi:tryptophan synthase alpha chain